MHVDEESSTLFNFVAINGHATNQPLPNNGAWKKRV